MSKEIVWETGFENSDREQLEFIHMLGLKSEGLLNEGFVLAEGRYLGKFTSKKSGKTFHKIKSEDGTIKALEGYKAFERRLEQKKVKENDYIQIQFAGYYQHPPVDGKKFNPAYSFEINKAKDM